MDWVYKQIIGFLASLEEALMEEVSLLARKDPVHTRIVDITALGLVEITRKKIREPLDKQLKIC